MAKAIVEQIEAENDAIEKIELSQVGKGPIEKSGFFLNIFLRPSFIESQIKSLNACNEIRLEESKEFNYSD